MCRHPRTAFYQKPFVRQDGTQGRHVAELCLDCGARISGPGTWVPVSILKTRGIDPEKLPVLESSETARGGLFDGLEG